MSYDIGLPRRPASEQLPQASAPQPTELQPIAQVEEAMPLLPPKAMELLAEEGRIPPEMHGLVLMCLEPEGSVRTEPTISGTRRLPGAGLAVFARMIEVARRAVRVPEVREMDPEEARASLSTITTQPADSAPAQSRRESPGAAAAEAASELPPPYEDGDLLDRLARGLVRSRERDTTLQAAAEAERLPAPDPNQDASAIRLDLISYILRADEPMIHILRELEAGNFFAIDLPLRRYLELTRFDPPLQDETGVTVFPIVHRIISAAQSRLLELDHLPEALAAAARNPETEIVTIHHVDGPEVEVWRVDPDGFLRRVDQPSSWPPTAGPENADPQS